MIDKKNNAIEQLQLSIRATTKCRYNAASRLKRQGSFAFFTTTVLSLGLIFIPLMQNSGLQLKLPVNVLNMMSIFLAVAVLVYSVVIGTSRYELRAENLTKCGNKLKELNRSIVKDLSNQEISEVAILEKYQGKYSVIVEETENHERRDYRFATLEMKRDYNITKVDKAIFYILSGIEAAPTYLLPSALLFLEAIFITDMIGVTSLLKPYLGIIPSGSTS